MWKKGFSVLGWSLTKAAKRNLEVQFVDKIVESWQKLLDAISAIKKTVICFLIIELSSLQSSCTDNFYTHLSFKVILLKPVVLGKVLPAA